VKTFEEWYAQADTFNGAGDAAEAAWHARDAEVDALRAKLDEARKLAKRLDEMADDRTSSSGYRLACVDNSQLLLAVLGDKEGK